MVGGLGVGLESGLEGSKETAPKTGYSKPWPFVCIKGMIMIVLVLVKFCDPWSSVLDSSENLLPSWNLPSVLNRISK